MKFFKKFFIFILIGVLGLIIGLGSNTINVNADSVVPNTPYQITYYSLNSVSCTSISITIDNEDYKAYYSFPSSNLWNSIYVRCYGKIVYLDTLKSDNSHCIVKWEYNQLDWVDYGFSKIRYYDTNDDSLIEEFEDCFSSTAFVYDNDTVYVSLESLLWGRVSDENLDINDNGYVIVGVYLQDSDNIGTLNESKLDTNYYLSKVNYTRSDVDDLTDAQGEYSDEGIDSYIFLEDLDLINKDYFFISPEFVYPIYSFNYNNQNYLSYSCFVPSINDYTLSCEYTDVIYAKFAKLNSNLSVDFNNILVYSNQVLVNVDTYIDIYTDYMSFFIPGSSYNNPNLVGFAFNDVNDIGILEKIAWEDPNVSNEDLYAQWDYVGLDLESNNVKFQWDVSIDDIIWIVLDNSLTYIDFENVDEDINNGYYIRINYDISEETFTIAKSGGLSTVDINQVGKSIGITPEASDVILFDFTYLLVYLNSLNLNISGYDPHIYLDSILIDENETRSLMVSTSFISTYYLVDGQAYHVDCIDLYYGNEYTPTKSGHTFNCWSTTSTGSINTISNGSRHNVDLTVYARFNPNKIVVSFVTNGGTAKQSYQVDYGTSLNSSVFLTVTKTGYVIDGIYLDSELSNLYNYGALTGDTTFYYKWTEGTFKIVFNGTTIEDIEGTYGSSVTWPENPTKTGYTFGGWYSDSACTVAQANISTIPSSNTNVYAKWVPVTFTVTYHTNFGDDQTETQVWTYGVNSSVKALDLSRAGFVFTGWNTKADGTGNSYAPGTVLTIDENLQLLNSEDSIVSVPSQTIQDSSNEQLNGSFISSEVTEDDLYAQWEFGNILVDADTDVEADQNWFEEILDFDSPSDVILLVLLLMIVMVPLAWIFKRK